MGRVLTELRRRLAALGDPDAAAFAQRFFKTGPGEYAEGDRFMGIRVPAVRALAREFKALPEADALALLQSPLHEERLLALLLLVQASARGDAAARARIYRGYMTHRRFVNNWDLVDTSAPQIVGGHLAGTSRAPLDRLARSRSLWERRIAIIATLHFIRTGDFADTLRIADILRGDSADLMHKAVGWMLREVGNRDRGVEEAWLASRYQSLPRTMLRYAIEKFPEARRRRYLRGTL